MITKSQAAKSLPANEVGVYGVAEAARYLRVAPATLRSWVAGREYSRAGGKAFFEPPIALPDPSQKLLSFENLIEAHVLWALRVEHGVSLGAVRTALAYAEQELGIERLLLNKELKSSGDLFLERYGQLVNLSRSGQLAMKKVLQAHLRRIDWSKLNHPVRLFPLTGTTAVDQEKSISIDPAVGFGRPMVHKTGVSTEAITARIDAGETPRSVARDYAITVAQVEAAVIFERAA